MKELFNKYSPCLILIDEWIAYARQLYTNLSLPAGTFDTQFTFAQTLTEAARDARVPIDDPGVASELTKFLEENWIPVIEQDADGEQSIPRRLERDNPNLARYSAVRRVARTIYMGSAPSQEAAHRGIDEKAIKLGCVQPGETIATFGDALRRLTDNATFLYVDGRRFWYSTQPTVRKTA